MKTNNIIKFFIALIAISGLLNSCVNDNSNFQTPKIACQEPDITTTNTLSELKANAVGNIHQITDDIIVTGYVASSDEQGNFYTSLSIQNQDGTAGVKLSMDRRSIYTQFKVGQKVYIKAKNLYISNSGGGSDVGLGSLYNGNIGRLPDIEIDNFLFRSCEAVDESTLVHSASLSNVNDAQLNTLVAYDNVQFKADEVGGNYFNPNNSIGSATNRYIVDENGNELIVRNSQFADFANEPLPSGNGKIRGVLSKFNGAYQLFIRSTNDVQFTDARQLWGFATSVSGNLTTIANLRAAFNSGNYNITNNAVIEGVITMSTQTGNIPSRNAFIQDNTGAIALRFDSAHSLFEGYKVRVNIKNMSLGAYAGLVQISNINQAKSVQVLDVNASMPSAKTIGIDELLSGNYQAQLVKLNNVQFTQTLVTYGGGRSITDCNLSLSVYTSSFASFANEIVPSGNGTIMGVASEFNGPQLLLRNTNDTAAMTGTRCKQAEPFFSEDFEATTSDSDITLGGWLNIAETGSVKWHTKAYGGNTYAEFSSYLSGDDSNISWLVTPAIDMDSHTNEYLTFETAQHHFRTNSKLEVFISNDFDGTESGITSATWVDAGATLAGNADKWYAFIPSGHIDLSNYSGKIYIAFKYTGSGNNGGTGGFQVDNIKVLGK